MLKQIPLFITLIILSYQLNATIYYVSNSEGKNRYNGKSIDKPWRSLKKVNRKSLKPGDSVLFKRGDIWRGQLIPKTSGNILFDIYFGAYGEGDKPLILGSVQGNKEKKWKSKNENIWRMRIRRSKGVGNIILDSIYDLVNKVPYMGDLKNNFDFYSKKNRIYLKLDKNPATVYKNIEMAINRHIIKVEELDYLTFENLAIKYGAANGFSLVNVSNITIRNCDISFIGGGYLAYGKPYGNGIEFWESAENCLVENCTLSQIYDTALTNQGMGFNMVQKNITYRNNLITKADLACFEYFGKEETAITENIVFENNKCMESGYGWSYNRPDNFGGFHILFHRNQAQTKNFFITNNEFYRFKNKAIVFFSKKTGWNGFDTVVFENNTHFYEDETQYLFGIFTDGKGWDIFRFKEKETYIEKMKKDKTSNFLKKKHSIQN